MTPARRTGLATCQSANGTPSGQIVSNDGMGLITMIQRVALGVCAFVVLGRPLHLLVQWRVRWFYGSVAVSGPRIDRGGIRPRRHSGLPPDGREWSGDQGGSRGGRPARQPHSAQSHPGFWVSLRRRYRSERAHHRGLLGSLHVFDAQHVVLLLPASSRRSQLCADARRDLAGGHRTPAAGEDPGRWPVSHGDRVLRLRGGRSSQLDQRPGGERPIE